MFSSLSTSVDIYENNSLHFESPVISSNESITSSSLWTLKQKPPTRNDALNFVDKFKNIHYNIQFQPKHNDVIENVRKNLLSLTLPFSGDLNFFASESNIILEPLKQPPLYITAFKWLEAQNSKYKRKNKITLCNKRKGIMTPESLSKSILLKKINHSTPNSSLSKFCSSPYTPMKKENKCLKSRRKLSTIFLESLSVRKHYYIYVNYNDFNIKILF